MRDSAYFVAPPGGPGPGVLLLHSWWGLDEPVKDLADRISDRGYTVLAPDLTAGGTFEDADAAQAHLAELDPNRLASLTQSSAHLLRERSVEPTEPIALVGLSMGASLGLWASIRMPDVIDRVVAFYGIQHLDFDGSASSYQLHFASDDAYVDADEAAFMEATIGLAGLTVESHTYPGTSHWFFEPTRPGYDRRAAELAWERLVPFLER